MFVNAFGGGEVRSTLNPWDTDGNLHEVVPCPRPEAEDAARLKPTLDRLKRLALERAKRD